MCPPLIRKRGHKGHRLYNVIFTSRRQAGLLHLTHRPSAVAAGSAHTGSGLPQKGQGTGARSALPEPRKEGGFVFGNGYCTRCTSLQFRRQREDLPLVLVEAALLRGHIGQVCGAPVQDTAEKAILRQAAQQRPEAPPVHLFTGQVDAVRLLKGCHDVRCIAVVVVGGTRTDRSTARVFFRCSCVVAQIELQQMPVGVRHPGGVCQQILRGGVKPCYSLPGKAQRLCLRLPADVGVRQPDHMPEVRVYASARPSGGQRVQQQVSHSPAQPVLPAAACGARPCQAVLPDGSRAAYACACVRHGAAHG
nr:MAG TPA: hypothetical protein [Caudoviricetes sp.]